MRRNTSINQKDLTNSVFELGGLLEEVEGNILEKLASSSQGKELLAALEKARKNRLLSDEQIKSLLKAVSASPLSIEVIYAVTSNFREIVDTAVENLKRHYDYRLYEYYKKQIDWIVNNLQKNLQMISSSPIVRNFVKELEKTFDKNVSIEILKSFVEYLYSPTVGEKLANLLSNDGSKKIIRVLTSRNLSNASNMVKILSSLLFQEERVREDVIRYLERVRRVREDIKRYLESEHSFLDKSLESYMKMLEEAGYKLSKGIIPKKFLIEESLNKLFKTIGKRYGKYPYLYELLEAIFSKKGLDRFDSLDEVKLYIESFLLSPSLEKVLKKRDSGAIRILPIAGVLIERYGKDGLDITNNLIRILLIHENIKTDTLYYIEKILPYIKEKETFEKLLQLVETYAKIDSDLTVKILESIHTTLDHQFKKREEEVTKSSRGVIDYGIIVRKVNNDLSVLLNTYLREGKEDAIKKLAEYIKGDSKLVEELLYVIGQASLEIPERMIKLGDIIESVDLYHKAGLAYYILDLVAQNLKATYVLFNKRIANGLSRIPKDYSRRIARELAKSARYEKINENNIKLIADLMDKYGIEFPDLVEEIVSSISSESQLKEIVELVLSEDVENVLKNEYSRYSSSIKEFVAKIIKDATEHGYIDKLKSLLNNSDFKRILEVSQDMPTSYLIDLAIKIKEIAKYKNLNEALGKFANVLSIYNNEEYRSKIVKVLEEVKGEDKTMEALNILEKYAPNLKVAIGEICRKYLFKLPWSDYICRE